MDPYRFRAGHAPLLVSIPHMGTYVPEEIASRLTPAARALPDTDWHLDQLYDFLDEMGASVLMATHSRYVVDLNRPPDDASLYPGQDVTGLVPVDTFARESLYAGALPDAAEIAQRRERYWRPYHDRLATELARLREQHGYVLLWDAHSIASRVPRFFDGRLPDFNLGTGGGTAADPALAGALLSAVASARGYTAVLDGRFKGGYITRRYGDPASRVHAIQLELAQETYMQESPPYAFDESRAAQVRPHLRRLLETLLAWGRDHLG
ncbi:MAG: N-formylglutamate deformylase [Burkholderiales bacterium]|jgi:N-formylglutamate deformylase|nr:N-formylglutamate deformylase [Burkholderiales bacterium]